MKKLIDIIGLAVCAAIIVSGMHRVGAFEERRTTFIQCHNPMTNFARQMFIRS